MACVVWSRKRKVSSQVKKAPQPPRKETPCTYNEASYDRSIIKISSKTYHNDLRYCSAVVDLPAAARAVEEVVVDTCEWHRL
ncbi:predicted protein [Sclerotinia sclerotiorum 1980 UF-70]|uniref:Uncharacterized protein n=1 Tax=Sclerotinia sclerotiorum (strain ATCC 18683 / 1980 / Ss-1) TaxID=665079 RepID=A7E6I2_SCLS1|nr:predicted protein [Sclerotinia sclerotiorum 1980 UF-70]EDN91504.1 predicted protein [Sclerotinia sclerotiorum 1980 UF-70]